MKISVLTAHGWLSAQPVPEGHIVRWEYRDVPVPGTWETFDVQGFEFPAPLPVPFIPPPPPPPVDIWPPLPGMHPPKPPNIITTNVEEVRKRVRWALWNWQSSDDESYWMKVIVLNPEPGHTPGWVADDYWYDWIARSEGAGKGYVWPPK